jgi:hypothetical protein
MLGVVMVNDSGGIDFGHLTAAFPT